MLSFGLAVAATFDGSRIVARNPSEATFYTELKRRTKQTSIHFA